MVHRFRRFIPALFVIGIACLCAGNIQGSSAHATDAYSQEITLSPASTDLAIDPGASASKTVDINNSGAKPFNVSLSTSSYYVSGDNYDPHFTQLPGTVDASQWVHLSLINSKVAGNSILTVPYTVDIPKGTTPGGYYAVLFVETSSDDETTGVISHSRIGDVLYITVNGDIKSGGTINGDALPSVSFGGTIAIGAKISNSGGTHFVTKAIYSVTDFRGHEVFNSNIERYILPQTEREISTPWSPQSLFGIFTIHRNATIDGVVKTLPDQTIVVTNPWMLVLAAFLIGILIGVPFRRAQLRRRSQKK